MSGKRRAAPLPQLPQDAVPALSPSSSASVSFPRSTSPSGITQFFSKPTKWFTRSASSPKLQGPPTTEPRASTSSTTRKPKISRPTDPRPILDSYKPAGSRSVLDLSARPQASMDMSRGPQAGSGDLRTLSHRGWSRSADDLSKLTAASPAPQAQFQDRVAQYRSRSGSASAAVAPRPVPSPSRSLLAPSQHAPVAISVSAPELDDAPVFHDPFASDRTYSFAPKLSSRLARAPPSPVRKGSASSECEPSRSTVFLSPEPESAPKRSSQIVYHSGFLNRLGDFSPAAGEGATPHLGRGWKSYKAELRGARLLFFKPPSDRAGEIKALFPQGIVAPGEGEDEDEEAGEEGQGGEIHAAGDTSAGGTGGDAMLEEARPQARRRRRAYWGRGPHPDLARSSDGSVQGGTMEALLHEAVFASTTGEDDQSESAEAAEDTTSYDPRRRAFATAVLLALPPLVGHGRVETELLRVCEQYVDGSEDDAREEANERVSWLAKEYLRLHGVLQDRSAWDKLAPGLWDGEEDETDADGGREPSMDVLSPHVGTFSPRPMTSAPSMYDAVEVPRARTPSDVSAPRRAGGIPPPIQTHPAALNVPGSSHPPSSPVRSRTPSSPSAMRSPTSPIRARSPSSPTTAPWPTSPQKERQAAEPFGVWGALATEGLSRGVLLALDPTLLARSLTTFHSSALAGMPTELSAGVMLGEGSEEEAAGSQAGASPTRSVKATWTSETKLMFGSDDAPHWLTKLVLLQVLSADAGSGPNGGHADVQYSQQSHGATLAVPVSPSSPRRSLDNRPSMQRTLSSSPPITSHMPSRPNTGGAPPSPRSPAPSSRTHTRSEVISVWARVGELCRQAGDEVSWRAIMAGLCARPVARLEKAWKRADPQALSAVESWVYGVGGGMHTAEHEWQTAYR